MIKSFILYQEYKENLKMLSQSQKGDLLDAIFAFNEGEEIALDPLVKMAFSFIKSNLERNKLKYENIIQRNKINGSKGGRPIKPKKSSGLFGNPEKPKETLNNNDNKNDIDNKNINVNKNIYDELTKGLKFVLEAKLNKKLNTNLWKKEIKLLVEKDLAQRQDAVADVKRAIQEVANRFGEQYFPVIQSASSLREKFSKIEAAIARSQPKQDFVAKDYINLMNKYDNE